MTSSEQELSEKLKDYQALGHESKDINVSALMLNALENQKSNFLSSKQKKWAYMISIGLPPLGLLFALKFFFGEEDDARETAIICILLTVVSGIVEIITIKAFFSGAGVTPTQIGQLKPQDVIDLTK